MPSAMPKPNSTELGIKSAREILMSGCFEKGATSQLPEKLAPTRCLERARIYPCR
jgi:hypothetical protein